MKKNIFSLHERSPNNRASSVFGKKALNKVEQSPIVLSYSPVAKTPHDSFLGYDDIEIRILAFLDDEGVEMNNPNSKMYDYFDRVREKKK